MTQALATHPGAAPIVNPAPNTLLAQQQHYATSSATGPGPSIPPLPGMHNITPKASAPPQQQSGPVFTDSVSLPSPPKGDAANLPEFDDLAKRFELLKKRG